MAILILKNKRVPQLVNRAAHFTPKRRHKRLVGACPDDVMTAWANINIAFGGWPPSEMDTMTLDDLTASLTIADAYNAKKS
mgnify:CR=1 FL=1